MAKDFSIPLVAEQKYVALLTKIAHQVELICAAHKDNPIECANQLRAYEQLIVPWCPLVANDMLSEVRRNRNQIWNSLLPKKGNRFLQQRADKNAARRV